MPPLTLEPYLNQIFFYYKPESTSGYYYALDGEAVLDRPPVGVQNDFLIPKPRRDIQHAFTLGYDDPVGDEVLRAYWNAMSVINTELSANKEARYLLAERGSAFTFGWQKELTLSSNDSRFYAGKAGDMVDENNKVSGVASGAYNRIIFFGSPELAGASYVTSTFREEVSHLVDYHVAREMGLKTGDARFWSHLLVRDEALASDMSYLQNLEESGRRKRTFGKRHELPAGINLEGLISETKGVLTLPEAPYVEIRASRDGEPDNAAKDSENMVKLHVLRMKLEDLYAQEHGTTPNHYGTDTPMLRTLADVAPGLTAAYREQWLPAVNIVTQAPDPLQRKTQLVALAARNGMIAEAKAPVHAQEQDWAAQQWLPATTDFTQEYSR